MNAEPILLEEMTWPEVEAALAAGRTTVVFALGATEQHGPHLPLLVDAVRGDRLAVDVARRLGGALVAPTIRVGCSDHHMAFPGTLSLRRSTLEALCTDYCASLAHHGFRRICLIPSHGGNFAPLSGMLAELKEAVGPGCRVHAYTDLHGFLDVWTSAVEEMGASSALVGGHADIAESSEMMVIRPDLVRTGRAEEGFVGGRGEEFFQRAFREGFRSVTPNGILGDARGLSRAIGERCLQRAAEAIAASLEAQA